MAGVRSGLAIASTLAVLLHAPRAGAAFSEVYFFGDSLSDTGVFRPVDADALLGLGLVSTYGYDPARWTNAGGRLWVDDFAAALGHDATSVADGGTNYARGGARADELADQIVRFGVDHGGVADPGALYVVFAGGNDMLQGYSTSHAVAAMLAAIDQLRAQGARTFLVGNFYDVSHFAPATGPLAPYAPIPADASAWLSAYASELSAALATLSDITVHEVDVKGLFDPVLAEPEAHGFSAGLALCVNDADCMAGVGVDEYLMFDHVHATSAGHALIAAGAQAALPQCANGLDDDWDGRVDWLSDGTGDPQCASLEDGREARVPWACGIGPELLLLAPLLAVARRRRDWPPR